MVALLLAFVLALALAFAIALDEIDAGRVKGSRTHGHTVALDLRTQGVVVTHVTGVHGDLDGRVETVLQMVHHDSGAHTRR